MIIIQEQKDSNAGTYFPRPLRWQLQASLIILSKAPITSKCLYLNTLKSPLSGVNTLEKLLASSGATREAKTMTALSNTVHTDPAGHHGQQQTYDYAPEPPFPAYRQVTVPAAIPIADQARDTSPVPATYQAGVPGQAIRIRRAGTPAQNLF